MKRFLLVPMLLLSLASCFDSAKANEYALSTEDWHTACTRPDSSWIDFCHGYIQAVVDSLPASKVCLDPSVTKAALVTTVDNFLRKNPGAKIGKAFGQIQKIIALHYPCD